MKKCTGICLSIISILMSVNTVFAEPLLCGKMKLYLAIEGTQYMCVYHIKDQSCFLGRYSGDQDNFDKEAITPLSQTAEKKALRKEIKRALKKKRKLNTKLKKAKNSQLVKQLNEEKKALIINIKNLKTDKRNLELYQEICDSVQVNITSSLP